MTNLFKTMGVINITPNSFSDGGNFNDLGRFTIKFNELLTWADVIDIGAESSAPFNSAISFEEELNRFEEVFFPFVEKTADPKIIISVDTYKAKTFKVVAQKLNALWPQTSLIWNDVSGVVDEELLDLLYSDLSFDYVLSHNLCDTRANTLKHMNFVSSDEICDNVISFFEATLNKIETDREIYLDPCFGFSKSREQNHNLLKDFSKVLDAFPTFKWVYGISRKSFLRFPKELNSKDPDVQSLLDQIQNYFLVETYLKAGKDKLIFRVHDQKSKKALNSTLSILGENFTV